MNDTFKPPRKSGFGRMSPERRREVAAKGGSSVNAANRAFSRDRELAAAAGAKGGAAGKKKEQST